MSVIKKHSGFIVFFFFLIVIFLHSLIIMRSGFLWGDNYVQFLPWFKCYAESIKSFSFPFWVKAMGSGFPLMAEGQVGGFYPLNILFFFFLPFEIAYNYSVIFHFIIAGIFAYMYARKLGADEWGGGLAALTFSFGSAYAGCFYNIITLRTLAWFPLVLLLMEYFIDTKKIRHMFFAGAILGFQFLAGFAQMALYSAFFCAVYFIYRALLARVRWIKITGALLSFGVASTVIALPQLLLTIQLAGYSGREGQTSGFALWGSMFPSGLLGAAFPYSFSFKGNLYAGILSLLFVIFCICSLKKNKSARPVVLMLALSIFLALGGYNPLYAAFVKLTKLYMLRNPSKFLFFGSFSLSILAGLGFTAYFNSGDKLLRKRSASIFIIILSVASILFVLARFILCTMRDRIMQFGDYYIRHFIYNKPHHRYSLEFYLDNMKESYDAFAAAFSFSNPFVVLSLCFFIVSIFLCILSLRKNIKYAAILLILADLYVFSFYGKGYSNNIRQFDYLAAGSRHIYELIRDDKEIFRILPFDIKSGKLPNWSWPNANIAYSIDSAACYTPLALRPYRDFLSALEVVDDSLGLRNPRPEALYSNMGLLRLLNIKYVISPAPLKEGDLEKITGDQGVFLYRLKGCLPRIFYSDSIISRIEQSTSGHVNIAKYANGLMEAEVEAGKDGFVIFSENYYPGWRVFVDGREGEVLMPLKVLQAVYVPKGRHKVLFTYKPQFVPGR